MMVGCRLSAGMCPSDDADQRSLTAFGEARGLTAQTLGHQADDFMGI